jgi:hypothetical protein
MVTGCRRYYCPERTTLVYEQEKLAAVVVTHLRCVLFQQPTRNCTDQPVFTVMGGDFETLQRIAVALDENENVLQASRSSDYEPASHILISIPDWQ